MLQNLFTGLIPPLGSLCLVALQIVYRGSAPFGPFLLKLNLDSSASVRRGGRDIKKITAKPPLTERTGWSIYSNVSECGFGSCLTTPSARQKDASRHFL